MKLKKIDQNFRLIVRVVVSNDIRTPDTPVCKDGKGGWYADNVFSLVSKIKCEKFNQDLCNISSRSEYRTKPKPTRACLQQLVKISLQLDVRCVLLYRTNKVTFIFIQRDQNKCEQE